MSPEHQIEQQEEVMTYGKVYHKAYDRWTHEWNTFGAPILLSRPVGVIAAAGNVCIEVIKNREEIMTHVAESTMGVYTRVLKTDVDGLKSLAKSVVTTKWWEK